MKFYFISPIGATSPGLFETFPETFIAKGHSITQDIYEAECVFFDSHSGYLPYNWNILNIVLKKQLPVVYFDAFDYHGDSSKHWPLFRGLQGLDEYMENDWAKFMYQRLVWAGKPPFIYFMRKMQTNSNYGNFVYPLELCQFPDHDFPITTADELYSRPNDIFFIGNTSPSRESICGELQKHFKCDFVIGHERIPHDEWLNRARQAKIFCSISGGGLSDERPYQLMTIGVMLKDKNLHLQSHPFTDCVNCIEVSVQPTKDEIDGIKSILMDKEYLYEIYTLGVAHLKEYYNETYRSNYILKILQENGIC